MMRRLRGSIGARILLLAVLNLLLLIMIGLVASGVRVPRSLTQMLMQSAEPRLQDVARRIALDLERTPEADATALLNRYGADLRTRFMLVHNDGTLIAGTPLPLPAQVERALLGRPPGDRRGLPDGFGPPPRDAGPPPPGMVPPGGPGTSTVRMPQTPAQLITVTGTPANWIILRTPIRFAEGGKIIPGSLIVVPFRLFGDALLFPSSWLWWMVLAVAITAACWLPFLRGLTRSLKKMELATGQIAHGRFDTRLEISRHDEIGRLASSIEAMASRLGTLVSGQKRFLGDSAHELRSPLGRMQVALEILRVRVGEGERGYVDDLKEDVEALSTLTDQLLLFAKAELMERGRLQQVVTVAPLIDRVVAREGQGASFAIEVDPGLAVQADAQLLERAIANIIRNAVKYAGDGGSIAIRSAVVDGNARISISDSGPGVAEQSLERIFEPFYREDAARNRKTGGVGLGLAIVRSAVEACGGTVTASSLTPHGLQVTITLPASQTQ